MRVRLIPADGSAPFDLTRDVVLVGRGEDCDLRVEHKSVSKRHCVLVVTDGLVLLRDLGSTNGTRVNGTRVRRAALLPNDLLAFANFRFTLMFGSLAVPLPPAGDPGDTAAPRPDDDENFEVVGNEPAPPPGVRRNDLPDTLDDDKE
jgi:pSer/pThr/pTyr-binding forkhead associated (FHA) protein